MNSKTSSIEVVVIGAGFAGLYLIHELRRLGISVRGVEAGSDVGGTWFWNRYPGARCDVESIEYCYSFSKILDEEWSWSERYATQPEILRYLNFAADRLELRRHITFDARVSAATYHASDAAWRIHLPDEVLTARFCIMATGCLSLPNLPPIKGIRDFGGRLFHTADWPRESVDFSSRRVGVVGTGSSGCQVIPIIAKQAGHLTVFQRTANYCIPAGNRPHEEQNYRYIKQHYDVLRQRWRSTVIASSIPFGDRSALEVTNAEREQIYELRWRIGGGGLFTSFNDLLSDKTANDTLAEFIRRKIRSIVKDQQTADNLCPGDLAVGAKRVPLVTDYFETFNRENVRLCNVHRAPIKRILPSGVFAGDEFIELDDLIFATGFDAMTGALEAIDIQGSQGKRLIDLWKDGPMTYLGLMVAGFPNLFLVTGPGSPSVLSNVVVSIEQHVSWIADCIRRQRDAATKCIEATEQAQTEWMSHVEDIASQSLISTSKSWYSGDNIEGKPHSFSIYLGGVPRYKATIDEIADKGYTGFKLTPDPLIEPVTGATQ